MSECATHYSHTVLVELVADGEQENKPNASELSVLDSSTLLDEACQMRRAEPTLRFEGCYLRTLVEHYAVSQNGNSPLREQGTKITCGDRTLEDYTPLLQRSTVLDATLAMPPGIF